VWLGVSLEVLKAQGVSAPDTGPIVQSLLLQPSVAAATDAAIADLTRRMEQAFATIVRESVALMASGVVAMPEPSVSELTRLRELREIVSARGKTATPQRTQAR
jgi:hypothetical protein